MLVELDIFSGRPNPRWELDEQTYKELLRLQSRLKPARQAAPEPPGLGYRGFQYADEGGPVRAYHGFVVTSGGVFEDSLFTIELYLLEHVPAEYLEVARRTASELTRAR
jgi:hypothetical protein